jgi:hypothetical protein
MASRIDYSQNRKLYVGTTAELSVADGNIVVDNQVIIGNSSSSFMLDVLSSAKIGSRSTESSSVNYENKLVVAGKNNYSDGTTWYGNYGQILLSSTSNMTASARQFLITNALDNNKFAIIRSVDAGTNPVTNSTGAGVNSGTADFVIDNTGNVGIGTTSPSASLEVNGALFVGDHTGTVTPTDGIWIEGADGDETQIQMYSLNGSVFHIKNAATKATIGYGSSGNRSVNFTNTGAGDIKVGIGTDTPLYKLQVQDRIHIEDTTSQQPKISFSENANTTGEFVLEYNGVGGGAGNYVSFYSEVSGWVTKGNGLNYIPENGYVGIGTATPGSELEVAGKILIKATAPFLDFVDTNSFTDPNDRFRVRAGGNEGLVQWYDDSEGSIETIMNFKSGGNVIVPSGNVGIGETNPGYKLDVKGSANNADIGIRINNSFDDNSPTSNPNAVVFLNAASNNGYLRVHGAPANTASKHQIDLGSTAGSSFLTFSPSGSERMRIASNGAIKFNAYSTGYLKTDASGNITADNTGGGLPGGPYLPLTGGTLTGALNVDNSVKAEGFFSHVGTYTANTYTNDWQKVYSHDWSTFSFSAFTLKVLVGGNTSNNNINADVHINYKMQNGAKRIYANIVNFGTAPLLAENFQINLDAPSNSSGSWTIWHKLTSTYQTPFYTLVGSGIGGTWYSEAPVSAITGEDDTWTERLIINSMTTDVDNDGNVGIGTTSPTQAKLVVAGNVILDAPDARLKLKGGVTGTNSGIDWTFNTDSTQYARVDLDYDTRGSVGLLIDSGYPITLDYSSGRFAIQKNGSEKMRIDSDGNVGIGTTDPQGLLEVQGAAPYIYITDTTETDSGIIFRDLQAGMSQAAAIKFNSSNNKLQFYNNDAAAVRMTIDTAGNVGMGTTGPDQKLHVNSGRILVSNTSTPIYIKAGSSYKSWVHHIGGDDSYIFAPSTVDNGETWDWPNGTKLGTNGVVTAKNFQLSSDERFKNNIKDIKDIKVNAAFKSFEMESSPGEKRYGVVAQELEKTNPELIETDYKGFKSVKYIDLLIAKIAELEARLEKLEK